jgi:hypothetical protein
MDLPPRASRPTLRCVTIARRFGRREARLKDGNYDLCFSADGYTGLGSLVLDGQRAKGSDGRYQLEGNLFDGAPHITAVFNVLMQPRLVKNTRIPTHYSLQMSGTAKDESFSLIGTGPLGLIVEISGSYAGPLTEEQHEGF